MMQYKQDQEEDGIILFEEGNELSDTEDGDAVINATTPKTEETVIAKRETKVVSQLRLTVLVILVLSALSVAAAAFFSTRNSELLKFEENFKDDAFKVLQSIGIGVENTFSSLDLLATTIVSLARSENSTWPQVTIPNYANRISKTQSMNVGMAIWYLVVVKPEERESWEEYAWKNRYIVNETLRIQATDDNYNGQNFDEVALSRSIHDDFGPLPYNITRNFCALWQQYPISSNTFPAFNWDWYSTAANYYFLQMMENGMPVVGEPYILPDPNNADEVANAEYWADVYAGWVSPGDNPMEPASDIIYPIIDEIESIKISNEYTNASDKDIVGVLSSSFYWRDLLKNLLPNGRKGMVVVFDNPCKAAFTYQVNGPFVTYLGRGDKHNPKYNKYAIRSGLFESNSAVRSKYTGIPIDKQYCQFTLTAYPSREMESEYVTTNPFTYAAVAISIFVFTSIVFILYDCNVERRQRLVMSSAVRSDAVLSSLFPKNVKEQILEEKSQQISAEATAGTNTNGAIKSFLMNKDRNVGALNIGITARVDSSPPIAHLYPETTVFFADIAGFTAWSSVRAPTEVFTLLETLYMRFDEMAQARKVFKVETIGDSYVAVAGVPDPIKNHATVMARFAADVLSKTKEVVQMLSPVMGDDTISLCMRIGLNSGPTTAGVLRGEKSRFQLFGDTVNTAARMESNGVAGKIQCSHATADLLTSAGKGYWLTKRDEMVKAKGKGEMQTYWVNPVGARTTTTVSVASTHSRAFSISSFQEVLEESIGEEEYQVEL